VHKGQEQVIALISLSTVLQLYERSHLPSVFSLVNKI